MRSHRIVWVAVSLGVIATFGACVWTLTVVGDTLFRQHSGQYPDHPITNTQSLTEFREFPVYWLGPEYAGLPLTQLHFHELDNSVTLGYGYCTWTGGLMTPRTCGAPLEINEKPPCEWFKYPNTPTADPNGDFGWGDGVGVEGNGHGPLPTAITSAHEVILDLKVANRAYFASKPLTNSIELRNDMSARCTSTPTPGATVAP